jgi:DNA primase
MALEASARVRAAASRLHLSNPEKVLWPDEGYTKLDLIRYYDFIFPIRTIGARLRRPDPWRGFFQRRQALAAATAALGRL